ncbi:MAG: tetratricopeptide repeat protein [Spirochaetaceae bacterium]
MFKIKSLYLFLLSATICSLFLHGLFFYVLGFSVLTIIIVNRGIFYTLRANKYLVNKEHERGYNLLQKAYKTGTIPFVVANGYIYLSLKYGYLAEAGEAIEKFLSGKILYKIKESQKNQILTQKALFLWKSDKIEDGITILNDLYESGYKTTIFYGNWGCLLLLNNQIEKAEKVCIEAYDYGAEDKVNLDNLITLYVELEKWDVAEKYYNELVKLSPTFPEAYYHGAIIALNNNKLEEATELANKCLEFELNNLSSISENDITDLIQKLKVN